MKYFNLAILVLLSSFVFANNEENRFSSADFERCYSKLTNRIDQDSSHGYLDSCLVIANDLKSDYYFGKYYLQRGINLRPTSLDSALSNLEKSIDFFANYQDSVIFVEALVSVAHIYLFKDSFFSGIAGLNQTMKSIDQHFDAYMGIDEERILLIKARCLSGIGIVYERFQDQELALDYFLRSLKACRNIVSKEGLRFKSTLLSNIGLVYSDIEDFEQSEYYNTLALDLKKNCGFNNSMGYNYRILAINAIKQGSEQLAFRYLNIADEHFEETNQESDLHKNTFWRAKAYFSLKNFKKACVLFTSLIAPFEKGFTNNDIANLFEELGNTYREMGEIEMASSYFEKGLIIRKQTGVIENRKAFDEFLIYFNSQESLFDDRLQLLKNVQEKEQLALKIEANEEKRGWVNLVFSVVVIFLVAIIFIILAGYSRNKKINSDLESSIQNQATLFKEVHHRVKNNFQIISSLLNLQSANEEELKSKRALSEAKSRIQSMSLVHELLYRKDNLSQINFTEYGEELIRSILMSYDCEDMVTYEINSSDWTDFEIDVAIPLGLILNESITNAIKYAFDDIEMGHIQIDLNKDADGVMEIVIQDNGPGFREGDFAKEREGLGLELIEILAEQIDGVAKIENDNGAKITVSFTV